MATRKVTITPQSAKKALAAMQREDAKAQAKRQATPDFNLEQEKPGEIPRRVIDELVRCRTEAKDYVAAFGDAIKAQAEKHKVEPAALRRYITALEADKTEGLRAELGDLEKLLA